jgi:hypothetical protein
MGSNDIGSSRSSPGATNWDGRRRLYIFNASERGKKIRTVRSDGFGYPGGRTALCTPLRHSSGRNPDSAPRPMLPPVRPAIYVPRVVARQPSVSSSIASSALEGALTQWRCLRRVQPWLYRSAACLTSTAPP